MSEPAIAWRALSGVPIFEWDPPRESNGTPVHVNNFGDRLSHMLAELILAEHNIHPRPASARRLIAIGSTLHFADDDDVIWGTGINGKVSSPVRAKRLDVRALRGPWSAELLARHGIATAPVFGDPALLLPRYLPELRKWATTKRRDALFVPNLNDPLEVARGDVTTISPTEGLFTVLRAIAQSRFVIGSSLHAIVIAESLGIPARFVASTAEHQFKYRDYLAGTGRPTELVAPSVDHALDLGGARPHECDLEALANAFPFDLWSTDRGSERATGSYRAVFPKQWDPRESSESAEEQLDELLRQLEASFAGPPLEFARRLPHFVAWRESMIPNLDPAELPPRVARVIRALDTRSTESISLALTLRKHLSSACILADTDCGAERVLSISLTLPDGLAHYENITLHDADGISQPLDFAGWMGSDWLVEYDFVLPASFGRHPLSLTLKATDGTTDHIPVNVDASGPWNALARSSTVVKN